MCVCGHLLVIVFGTTDVRLVLLHRVQLNLADGAGVALQRGSCTHTRRESARGIAGRGCGRGGRAF